MFIVFGLKSMIKQLLNLVYGFLHLKCIIKQLLDVVFVICKIINVSVILHITKTSSNNCLLQVYHFPVYYALPSVFLCK